MTKQKKTDTLKRDVRGYGSLPQFVNFHVPEEGFAPGAVVDGNEVAIVEMFADPRFDKLTDDDVSGWMPEQPTGEGWQLVVVANAESGPYAVWVRPASPAKNEGRAFAQEFLLGALIKVATKHLKTLSKPWIDLKQGEQQNILADVQRDCRDMVRDAVDIIASNARLTFVAEVDQVVFKDGVKAVLTLAKSAQAHALADAEGSYVTVVIEDRSALLSEGDALATEADQKPLFDQSTEGTALDTKPETVEA